MSDLNRLFWRTPTPLVTPLEDFTTAALAIAIGHDPEPFMRVIRGVDWDAQKTRSGRPGNLIGATVVSASDQEILVGGDDLDGGRLDLVVTIETANRSREAIWVEVKIDADITSRANSAGPRDQLDVSCLSG